MKCTLFMLGWVLDQVFEGFWRGVKTAEVIVEAVFGGQPHRTWPSFDRWTP